MPTTQEFTQVLHDWAEVFMRRSMQELVQFSRDAGLSMSQLSTLFRVFHSQACGVTAVGDHLGVTNAAASQMVDRLVQLGLLERSEVPQDRRVKRLTLTLKGKKVVEDSLAARQKWIVQLTETLTPEEQRAIIPALTALTRAALQLEPSHHTQSKTTAKNQLVVETSG